MNRTSIMHRAREAMRDGFAGAVRAEAPRRADSRQPPAAGSAPAPDRPSNGTEGIVDLERRRDKLTARFVELQWDLGGLVYEMAIRNRIRVDILVERAAVLQDTDAELGEVERILRTEQTGTAGTCTSCGAPHSSGAAFCWQCGQPILEQVPSESIFAP
jgi:hypothetical protein